MLQKIANIILLTDQIDDLQAAVDKEHIYNLKERIPALCVLYCKQGSMQININNEVHFIQEHDMFICQPNFLFGHYMRTPDFLSFVLCAPEKLFDELVLSCFNYESHWWEKQLFVQRHPVIHLKEEQEKLFIAYFQLLSTYLDTSPLAYQKQILRAIAQAAALEVLAYLDNVEEIRDVKQNKHNNVNQTDYIFHNFLELLQNNHSTHRNVDWYASQLAITPRYLGVICKEKCHKSASQLINEVVVERIKDKLLHTNDSIKEIAYQMEFPNVSFFCKYVRHHLGTSPLQFRQHSSIPLNPVQ
ncbi:MAG: helix-turn-helix domain-containing protein [Paludibacteraceae bacterium]|nr:helix-turn-helix domain-containing protein [Paludibacteraceae bacterium]